jgi:hypothetical protein
MFCMSWLGGPRTAIKSHSFPHIERKSKLYLYHSRTFTMLFLFCTLLAATILFRQSFAGDLDPLSTPFNRDGSQTRVLTAITVQSELERRQINFAPKHTLEHHYADRIYPPIINIFHHSNIFASRRVPALRCKCTIRNDLYEL